MQLALWKVYAKTCGQEVIGTKTIESKQSRGLSMGEDLKYCLQ